MAVLKPNQTYCWVNTLFNRTVFATCAAYVNVCVLPILSLSHIIYSQIRDDFVATALEVDEVGGICTLPSPFDKSFLTNVFDNVEAVAGCLGAISIAQQPEKKENRDRQGRWMNIFTSCDLHFALKKMMQQYCWCIPAPDRHTMMNSAYCIFSIKVNLSTGITLCII